MGMVEQAAYWDGIAGGGDEYDYDNVMDFLNGLDFPSEGLEWDAAFIDDFDASKLGPIPSDALTGLLRVPQNNFSNAALKLKPSNDVNPMSQVRPRRPPPPPPPSNWIGFQLALLWPSG
nr:GATA transcription factor 11-like [Ipomoea trifida]